MGEVCTLVSASAYPSSSEESFPKDPGPLWRPGHVGPWLLHQKCPAPCSSKISDVASKVIHSDLASFVFHQLFSAFWIHFGFSSGFLLEVAMVLHTRHPTVPQPSFHNTCLAFPLDPDSGNVLSHNFFIEAILTGWLRWISIFLCIKHTPWAFFRCALLRHLYFFSLKHLSFWTSWLFLDKCCIWKRSRIELLYEHSDLDQWCSLNVSCAFIFSFLFWKHQSTETTLPQIPPEVV